ncbi:MAG: hypothetical protein U1F04_02490 [Burkholderiaceae bacterium]
MDQDSFFVRNLAGLPVWQNKDLSETVFGGKANNSYWGQRFLGLEAILQIPNALAELFEHQMARRSGVLAHARFIPVTPSSIRRTTR